MMSRLVPGPTTRNNFHGNETNVANYGKGGAADVSL
jgi:hypothetical protein